MELCVIEGDGIGKEVIPVAVQVLQHLLPDLTIKTARAGWECFNDVGISLPDETIDKAKRKEKNALALQDERDSDEEVEEGILAEDERLMEERERQ